MTETRKQRACRIVRAAKRLGEPVRWEPKHAWGNCRCVGGLLMETDDCFVRFPSYGRLSRWFRQRGAERASDAADAIIRANDRGDFKAAWRIAYKALAGEP